MSGRRLDRFCDHGSGACCRCRHGGENNSRAVGSAVGHNDCALGDALLSVADVAQQEHEKLICPTLSSQRKGSTSLSVILALVQSGTTRAF